MVDQDSLMKESAVGMSHRLLGTQSSRDFIMKVSGNIPEKQYSSYGCG